MIPLIVLIAVTLIARLVGKAGARYADSWPAATRIGLAAMFCFTAVAHFNAMRSDLARMVPPWVPQPEVVVAVTGVLEILGAIGLVIPSTRKTAAIALIVFLIAVFPANVYAATQGVTLRGEPPTPLIPRTLLQLFFIAALWWSAIRDRNNGHKES